MYSCPYNFSPVYFYFCFSPNKQYFIDPQSSLKLPLPSAIYRAVTLSMRRFLCVCGNKPDGVRVPRQPSCVGVHAKWADTCTRKMVIKLTSGIGSSQWHKTDYHHTVDFGATLTRRCLTKNESSSGPVPVPDKRWRRGAGG